METKPLRHILWTNEAPQGAEHQMNNVLRTGWLAFAFCVLAFGLFVWPTPYEYEMWTKPVPPAFLCRERFTGRMWIYGNEGRWHEFTWTPGNAKAPERPN